MEQITPQQIRDFLDNHLITIKDGPFKKLKKKGDIFFVYDEDGKIKKSTQYEEIAAQAYNKL